MQAQSTTSPQTKLTSSSFLLAHLESLASPLHSNVPSESEEEESENRSNESCTTSSRSSGSEEVDSSEQDSTEERDPSRCRSREGINLIFPNVASFHEEEIAVGGEKERILIAGRGMEERRRLMRLLLRREEKSDSGSEVSNRFERKGKRGLEGFTEMGKDEMVIYYEEVEGAGINSLEKSYFKMKKSLNPLVNFETDKISLPSGEIGACFFLFSAPPSAEELAAARDISDYLPLVPILLLPPSSRTQKMLLLIKAVEIQLALASVRYVAASKISDIATPFFILPHAVFHKGFSANDSSMNSSLDSLPSLPIRNKGRDELFYLTRIDHKLLLHEKKRNFFDLVEIDSGRIITISDSKNDESILQKKLKFSQRVLERKQRKLLKINHYSPPPTPIPRPLPLPALQSIAPAEITDPFYVPSFFNLVGLNLRISLLKQDSLLTYQSLSLGVAFLLGIFTRELIRLPWSRVFIGRARY